MMRKIILAAALFSTNAFAEQGLIGTYYNAAKDTTAYWNDNFSLTAAYLATNPVASGSFIAKKLDYAGGDLTTIVSWLGSDAASFSGTNGDMSDGVITLKGFIDLSSTTTIFNISHDDGYRLFIDGNIVGQYGCCGMNNVTVNTTVGWHSIELDYNNAYYNHGSGGASLSLKENGHAIALSDLSTTAAVPEPEQVALMLLGLPIVSLLARRRKV